MRISLTGTWPSIFEKHPYPWEPSENGYTEGCALVDGDGTLFMLPGGVGHWVYDLYLYALPNAVLQGHPPTLTYGREEIPSVIRRHRLPWYIDVWHLGNKGDKALYGLDSTVTYLCDADGDTICCTNMYRFPERNETLIAAAELAKLAERRIRLGGN